MGARPFPRYRGARFHLTMVHERASSRGPREGTPPLPPGAGGKLPRADDARPRREFVEFTVVARRPLVARREDDAGFSLA